MRAYGLYLRAEHSVARNTDLAVKRAKGITADQGRSSWRMYNTRRSDMTHTGRWRWPVVTSDQLADGEVLGQVPTVNRGF